MKHTIEKRFLAVQKCLKGHAPKDVARQLGLVDDDLYVWLERYKQEGIAGLRRQPIKHADFEEKCKIVCEYEEKGVPLYRICAKYHVGRTAVYRWIHAYRAGGFDALRDIKPQGRPKNMGRPKKQEPQTELERLRYENEYLRAENALLKKVRALVEEREKRLHEIGRKPSKH